MTASTLLRDPLVSSALVIARQWCAGRIIDDRPALAHAVRVAVTVVRHRPAVPADLVAAALLHDAPEFAPADLNLDQYLLATYGPVVHRLIRAMQAEHDALDLMQPYLPDRDDDLLIMLSTADKVVALNSLLRRARRTGNSTGFFAVRQPLLVLLQHFRACQGNSVDAVPASLSSELAKVLDELDLATTAVGR